MTAEAEAAEPKVPAVLSFEFDGRPPRMGVPVVNGHQVMAVQSFDVHVDCESIPVVTLNLPAVDALRLIFEDEALIIRVGNQTREALISLGWTPPPGDPG